MSNKENTIHQQFTIQCKFDKSVSELSEEEIKSAEQSLIESFTDWVKWVKKDVENNGSSTALNNLRDGGSVSCASGNLITIVSTDYLK